MFKYPSFIFLSILLICSACGGDDNNDPQTEATVVPTAIVETLPPNEPRPTGANSSPTQAEVDSPTDSPVLTATQIIDATPTLEIAFPTVFQDQYPANVSAGRTLIVNYNVTLNNTAGRIFILVRNPANAEISRLVVSETATDSLEVEVATSGIHTILVAYENLDGNYSVSYEIR